MLYFFDHMVKPSAPKKHLSHNSCAIYAKNKVLFLLWIYDSASRFCYDTYTFIGYELLMTVTIKKQTIAKSSISKKQQLIIQAALKVFSLYGLTGASMEQIAQEADMSKSNLFYYFDSKDELYTAVLSHVLTEWLAPLNDIQLEQEPAQALSHYIDVKYQLSKKMPEASKLYALEIIQGAPHLTKILKGPLKTLVKEKTEIIDAWIAAGKLKPISAMHLIFHIWAVTQHYSDFAAQVEAVSGKSLSNKVFAHDAKATTLQLLVESLVIKKEETVA